MADAITIHELKAMLAGENPPTLLDVRRKSDYAAAPEMIETARWCDPETVDAWETSLPVDQPVVVYCVKGGAVSQVVADRLAGRKDDVRFLVGGILAWNAERNRP